MYALILTLFLQACPDCEIVESKTHVLTTKDKFTCGLVSKRLVDDYTINQDGIKQYAKVDCVKDYVV